VWGGTDRVGVTGRAAWVGVGVEPRNHKTSNDRTCPGRQPRIETPFWGGSDSRLAAKFVTHYAQHGLGTKVPTFKTYITRVVGFRPSSTGSRRNQWAGSIELGFGLDWFSLGGLGVWPRVASGSRRAGSLRGREDGDWGESFDLGSPPHCRLV
jgi:hypothetical protein